MNEIENRVGGDIQTVLCSCCQQDYTVVWEIYAFIGKYTI